MKRQTRFPAAQEQEYQATRFSEYAAFSRNVGIAGAILTVGLWLRDYASDAENAATTLPLRLLMACAVSVYVWSLWAKVDRRLVLACGYVAILTIEFAVLAIWGRLAGGYVGGFPGYMYIYMLTPLVMLPFTFRETAAVLLLVAVVPNVQVALGMAPGFPVLAFNALVWPACGIAIFAQREFDGLFRKLFLSQRRLAELATVDALTGAGNRRHFLERAEELLALARRHRRELSLLMVDIDYFKRINDHHGHAAGDEVLRRIVALLTAQLRTSDVYGRIGGEEFAVLLPETGAAAAEETAERLRRAIETVELRAGTGAPLRVTVSIGVASLPATGAPLSELMALADRRLYEAKAAGRNRVVGAASAAAAIATAR